MEDRNVSLAVSIPVGRYSIQGDLTIPRGSVAAIIFAMAAAAVATVPETNTWQKR